MLLHFFTIDAQLLELSLLLQACLLTLLLHSLQEFVLKFTLVAQVFYSLLNLLLLLLKLGVFVIEFLLLLATFLLCDQVSVSFLLVLCELLNTFLKLLF